MIIAFHSYKGGVGRTKVMVGVGAILAARGYKVGMLDFDLDSSGLVMMFEADASGFGQKELLNILREQRAALIPLSMRNVNDLVEKRLEVDLTKTNGRLLYLPTVADPRISDLINLSELNFFLKTLLEVVLSECGVNIVLIDVKPGYSPAFKNIIPEVSRAVIVSRLDRQNITGLGRLFQILEETEPPIYPLLVANMVPESVHTEEYIGKLVKACKRDVDIRIPFDYELFFDDDFQFLRDKSSPLRQEFEKLADLLVK